MLSTRTKLSLIQYLQLFSQDLLSLLFRKHHCEVPYGTHTDALEDALSNSHPDQVASLLDEIVKTQGDLRSRRKSSGPRYDERWEDLTRCLLLDNYKIEDKRLVQIEPTLEGVAPVEDDLERELRNSGLHDFEQIIRLLNNSAEDFRNVPPDYNGCLTNARAATQTLATGIAKQRQKKYGGSFDETKWGQVLAYLRTSSLITSQEENGLSGVFKFVSPGAHTPVGIDEGEMARLGRSLIVSMCYFLVKIHNKSG
jgi:hypothetical protein